MPNEVRDFPIFSRNVAVEVPAHLFQWPVPAKVRHLLIKLNGGAILGHEVRKAEDAGDLPGAAFTVILKIVAISRSATAAHHSTALSAFRRVMF